MTYPWETAVRPELTKDANGLYPGEAERGFPDFLRVTPATSLQASAPCAVLPSEAKS